MSKPQTAAKPVAPKPERRVYAFALVESGYGKGIPGWSVHVLDLSEDEAEIATTRKQAPQPLGIALAHVGQMLEDVARGVKP